jgi:hypothetical protein
LEAATQAIQEEFDKVLASIRNGRSGQVSPARQKKTIEDLDDFQKVMTEFRDSDYLRKHASPTRRLIQQKNSTWEHKELLKRNSVSNRDVYDLVYTTEPGKSFVIEPEGGQLNYDLAHKNPESFYDQVLRQNINQTSAIDFRKGSKHRVEVT